jgi:hypothetical protein
MDTIVKYTLEQETLEEAIKVAVMSKDKNNIKHSHQWRIYNYVYDEFVKNLLNVKNKINNSKDFDELFNIIDFYKTSGVGELFCYDTALRIGHYLNKLPEKIYIHAGTRKGLKLLLDRIIFERTIYKHDLPEPFCSCELTPAQLEDFFCVKKDYIDGTNKIKNTKKFC